MSIRTLIVGFLAAFCGISATLGVISISNNSPGDAGPKSQVFIATVDIASGQPIENNMVAAMDWYAESIPVNAVAKKGDVVGKFSLVNIPKGEIFRVTKIGDEPTNLLPADGMRAFAIDAKTASSNVGRNLVPGNRVDVIWQTNGRMNKQVDPISLRLLQNVKILAVGRLNSTNSKTGEKSITLEVKPKMDEDLAYSQAFGRLSLSLRNPSDEDGVEPIELVNFTKMLQQRTLEQQELANRAAEPNPAWKQLFEKMSGRIEKLENEKVEPEQKSYDKDIAIQKIGKGMRAITIQTPNESTGVAGLLEPGDRVDLQLTVKGVPSDMKNFVLQREFEHQVPSETLIENIEVLAVDTTLQAVERDGTNKTKEKMSKSVTLIVKEEMQKDIARASLLGNLTLTLRGESDRKEGPPETVLTVDEFVQMHMKPMESGVDSVANQPLPKIRTYKGPAVYEVPFSIR